MVIKRTLSVVFVSSTLVVAGCASKQPEQDVEEVVVKSEQPEAQAVPAESIPLPVTEQVAVAVPPLDSITVYFDYDSAAINTGELGLIETHAEYLRSHPEQRLVLEGHADERGSDEYNSALGERRAQAVTSALMARGIDRQQIRIVSFGESEPAVLGSDEDAWQQNRRVKFAYELTAEQQAALNFSAPQTLVLTD